MLAWLESYGRRVVNGRRVLDLEMSKVEQLTALRAAGFDVPRTLAVAGRAELTTAARKLPVPFIAKHNQGGKGLGVRRFDSHEEFADYLRWPGLRAAGGRHHAAAGVPAGGAAADHQGRDRRRRVRVRDHRGHRARRLPAVPGRRLRDRRRRPARPRPACSRCGRTSTIRSSAGTWSSPAAHGIEIAGFEFIETEDGRLVTYDINTNTNYNPEIEAVAPRPALPRWRPTSAAAGPDAAAA